MQYSCYFCPLNCIVLLICLTSRKKKIYEVLYFLLHCCSLSSFSIKETHGEALLFFQKHVYRDSGTSLLTLSLEYTQETFMHDPLLAWHFLSSGHRKDLYS